MRHGLDTSFLVAVEVACHPEHAAARAVAERLRRAGDRFVITPQVVAEFLHVVTDPKRFSASLTMEQALERVKLWWDAKDAERVVPTDGTVTWFLTAIAKHRLGRKRVLDSLLAGTSHTAGISSVLTLNPADFVVFPEFSCVPLTAEHPTG